MFQVGDKIVHPMHGAGIVDSIVQKKVNGVVREYYILKLPVGGMLVMIPTENSGEIGVRPVCERDEADKVIAAMPDIEVDMTQNWNRRYRENMERIKSGKYDVIILNYANCDMVGHTGVFEAAVKAVETVDTCLGRMLAAIEEMGGRAFVTADHGNADRMTDEEGKPFTAHTTNPVPFIAVGFPEGTKLMPEGGRLADIAPTMLAALGLPQPAEMTGRSMLE